jgi:hypothetical protein
MSLYLITTVYFQNIVTLHCIQRNKRYVLLKKILLVCESRKLQDSQITRLASSQYIAFFPSHETRETHETRTDIFARSESHVHKILARKIAIRDSLSTLSALLAGQLGVCVSASVCQFLDQCLIVSDSPRLVVL